MSTFNRNLSSTFQAEEEVCTLHGSPGGGVGVGSPRDGDPAVALLWGGREAGGDVGRVGRRRRHPAELGVEPGRAERAVVAGVARVRPPARAAQPRGHQPARRQQPAVRGAAHVAELAPRRAAPRPRGHLRLVVAAPAPSRPLSALGTSRPGRCQCGRCACADGEDATRREARHSVVIWTLRITDRRYRLNLPLFGFWLLSVYGSTGHFCVRFDCRRFERNILINVILKYNILLRVKGLTFN